MVIEGLKFQFLASGRSHTLITQFPPKINFRQNRVLLTKCVHLVYEIIKCSLSRAPFSLMFSDMIGAYEKFQKNIWVLVSFPRHKKHNSASRAHYSSPVHGPENTHMNENENSSRIRNTYSLMTANHS